MTTDITELAQREKFEAWARSQKLSIAYGDCGYVYSSTEMAWRAVKALSAELVEALEKTQHEAAVDWEAAASLNVENQELKRRIAELESRSVTVKLPQAASAGGQGYQEQVERILTDAGIKVEAE